MPTTKRKAPANSVAKLEKQLSEAKAKQVATQQKTKAKAALDKAKADYAKLSTKKTK